uniref:6-phosphogluconate dehydrogenase, decarboxylating n=1 Tax=Timspurckia oligopyrenoides TaxID=708627 RepID=A0A6T6LSJ9_9RHOD|mmetsp:Transcript_13283/g.23857  ORF Transcript_13283/g.23857 Transcript_13283/m.23857 type:complete len:546 (+) Transcript_13283:135-1772(+)
MAAFVNGVVLVQNATGCGITCSTSPWIASRRLSSKTHQRLGCLVSNHSVNANRSLSSLPVMSATSEIGLVGLAVMGQNLALNIAEKGFNISVYNRSAQKTDETVERADREGLSDKLKGFHDVSEFVQSIQKPRKIIMLVKAGAPVDATIATLKDKLEPGDIIIDGGNEWYTNTERRAADAKALNLEYIGMGVSGGEEGARNGPSLMPGGPKEAYASLEPIVKKVAAQVDDGPCVTYIGPGGAGNYVKMIHNGIEYGDMQLIGEAYDVLRTLGGFTAEELSQTFDEWNKGALDSFLIEITAKILTQKDDLMGTDELLLEKILDKSGSKGTGMWTIEESARQGVPAPTIAAALDARYLSSFKEERVAASPKLSGPVPGVKEGIDKESFKKDVQLALYASKICSYAQGMNLIRQAAKQNGWELDMGEISRIWKGGCIIRAKFLDAIKVAYKRDPNLASLLVDPDFASELASAQDSWRNVVSMAVIAGIAVPAMSGSLAYYDAYRRAVLPSSQMVQAQRDFFGSHTYQRLDTDGVYHTRWSSDQVTETL